MGILKVLEKYKIIQFNRKSSLVAHKRNLIKVSLNLLLQGTMQFKKTSRMLNISIVSEIYL